MRAEEWTKGEQDDEDEDCCQTGLQAVFLLNELEGWQSVEGGELEGLDKFGNE